MIIVDAIWETRNLGKRTVEFELENGDDLESLNEALSRARDYEYIVFKVPSSNMKLADAIQSYGYRYSESQLSMTLSLENMSVPAFLAKREHLFSYELADAVVTEEIFAEIRKGIFDTDRIALDSAFGKTIAAERYVNWIQDEISRGAELYQGLFKGEPVSFFTMKTSASGKEADPFLSGLYVDWKSGGLGAYATAIMPARKGQELGCKRSIARVSSNNLPILRIYESMGALVNGITHVFIKHE